MSSLNDTNALSRQKNKDPLFGYLIFVQGLTFLGFSVLLTPSIWNLGFSPRTSFYQTMGWVIFGISESFLLWIPFRSKSRVLKDLKSLQEQLQTEVTKRNQAVNDVTTSLAKANVRLVNQQKSLIASSKLTALGEMAGAIAHEINNPVTIIQGFSNQIRTEIKKEQPDYNKISQNIEKIGSACVRITKIITSLRTVSRDGSHEKMEPLPLKALLEETLPLCSEKFKNHGITLEINDFPENLEVQCQRISISQVLLNLLNNSHDAIENCEAKWIRISARELNDSVEISVTDSGKEIPKSIKEKLMTPFFTTKPIGKGTGLGLSIAKGIVEQHKGTFYLDNNSPNTRFVFTLPKAQSKSHEPSQAA